VVHEEVFLLEIKMFVVIVLVTVYFLPVSHHSFTGDSYSSASET
jgi:hypothetical protein